MTEKRFTVTQDFEEHHRQIRDNGHIIMGCFIEPQAEVIVNLLNELHSTVIYQRQNIDKLTQKNSELEYENNELKAKVDDKEVAVEVETCKIMEKVFALINEKIVFVNACEETSRIPKEDYYRGALEILELLKKELKRLSSDETQ